jgi:hypothetical protein
VNIEVGNKKMKVMVHTAINAPGTSPRHFGSGLTHLVAGFRYLPVKRTKAENSMARATRWAGGIHPSLVWTRYKGVRLPNHSEKR